MSEDPIVVIILIAALIIALAYRGKSLRPARKKRSSSSGRRDSPPAALRPGKVQKVIDGDTVIVIIRRRAVTLRLAGIDCPENGQAWGNTATAGLIKLIGGKHVLVETHCTDKYRRTVATIFVQQGAHDDLTNVNARMVALGHAWVSKLMCEGLPDQRQDELLRLHKWARSRRVGLWRHRNPIPPWKYRNGTH